MLRALPAQKNPHGAPAPAGRDTASPKEREPGRKVAPVPRTGVTAGRRAAPAWPTGGSKAYPTGEAGAMEMEPARSHDSNAGTLGTRFGDASAQHAPKRACSLASPGLEAFSQAVECLVNRSVELSCEERPHDIDRHPSQVQRELCQFAQALRGQ